GAARPRRGAGRGAGPAGGRRPRERACACAPCRRRRAARLACRERSRDLRRGRSRASCAARPERQPPRRIGARAAGGSRVTTEEALVRLAASTAEAVSGVLRGFVGDNLEQGAVTIVQHGMSPFAQLSVPAVATSVSYVNGVT